MIKTWITKTNDTRIYQNEVQEFLSTRTINNLENCCDLLIHWKTQGYVETDEELYEIAIIIKRLHPQSSINWTNTFLEIERIKYSNHLDNPPNNDDDELSDVFDNLETTIMNDNHYETLNVYELRRETITEELYNRGII